MAAGYGGQEIALNADTPYELESGLAATQTAQANAASAKTASQLSATLAPIQSQLAENTLATSNAALPTTQLTQLATQQAIQDNLIAEAATRAQAADDPQQAWHDSMTALAAQGVPQASQLADTGYSDKLAKTVAGFAGGAAVARASQLAAPGASGAGDASSGLTNYGPYDQNIDKMLSNVPAAQQTSFLQGKLQTVDQVRQALLAIQRSPDPIAEFDKHAAALAPVLGIPNAAGRFAGNPQGLAQWLDGTAMPEIQGVEDAFQTRLARTGLGLSQPLPPAQIEKTSEGDYAIRPDGKGGFTSTPITPIGKSILVGRDESGFGVYFNPTTQQETTGNVKLDSKPGTQRDTATMQKYQLLTAAGMDPQEAGMMVAGAKPMSQTEIQIKSAELAARQIATQSGGLPDPDSVAKTAALASQIAAQLTSANAITVPPPGAPAASGGGGGPAAPDYGPAPGKGIDPAPKLRQLSASPAQYQAARAQLMKTGNWKAFDQIFGQGAAGQMMAVKNRNAYTGP
jgi:hypothetical protein